MSQHMSQHLAAMIYWVVVAVWLTVLFTIAYCFVNRPRAFGATNLLLGVLAIDAARNIFENTYFGLYFGSQLGLFAPEMGQILGRPLFLVVPKILNVIAGCVVLFLLLLRWLPLAIKERGRAEQHASDLETLAAVDWLTGLYNRRHFETLLRAELGRSQRYFRPLSVLMIDVDFFKAINDRFGHAAGDRVLQAIANLCQAQKREADVVARLGGEEFAVMLPETTDIAAVQFAERLRQQVHDGLPIVEGKRLPITVSIGIAAATLKTSGIDSLLRCADQALYDAKRGGRDRVVVWRPPVEQDLREAAE
jgi:diguanylate cyclase (GGDEF)-like protein